MTMITEDGSGVQGANSYTSVAYVDAYLADRNRSTQNSWGSSSTAVKEAAIIAATDYIEQRFGLRFLGLKKNANPGQARSVLTLTQQPANGQQVVVGARTYIFNTVLGGADSVLIGASISESLDNLTNAINGNLSALGITVGSGTAEHDDVVAATFVGLTMLALARDAGEAGNAIAVTTNVTGASWSFATLRGGNDMFRPQPLSFPRIQLYDREGLLVQFIPDRLMQAVSEYAVRAVATTLLPDPTIDATGRAVVALRTKVGPIERETRYEEGSSTSQLLRSYPSADQLLREYLAPGGMVARG